MLNPLITIISNGKAVTHPFAGGKKKPNVTKKHVRLIWECMLGTVYALDPTDRLRDEPKYFDYDYTAAHAHAKVSQCTDLRICKPRGYRKFALWGIPPETKR